MSTNQLICEEIHNLIGLSKSSKQLLLQVLKDCALSDHNENYFIFYRYVFPKFSNSSKAEEMLEKHASNIESKIKKLQEELSVLRTFLSTPETLVESEWTNPELSLQVYHLYRLGETSEPRVFDCDPAKLGLRYLVEKQIASVIKLVGQKPQLIEATEKTHLWKPFTVVKSRFGRPFQEVSKTINWLEIPKELSSKQASAHIVNCTLTIPKFGIPNCIRRNSKYLHTYKRDDNEGYSLQKTHQIFNKQLVHLEKDSE